MLSRLRAKRSFRREAKRIAKDAEPAVRDTSEAIVSSLRETEEVYKAHGYADRSDSSYLDHWVIKKRKRFRR